MVDYYSILGLSPEANEKEIKDAWRKIARECHPDTGHNDPEKESRFRMANEAQQILLDPRQRKRYDDQLRARKSSRRAVEMLVESLGNIGDRVSKGDVDPFDAAREEVERRKDEIFDLAKALARSWLSSAAAKVAARRSKKDG